MKKKTYSTKPPKSRLTKSGIKLYKVTMNVGGKTVKRIVTIPEN